MLGGTFKTPKVVPCAGMVRVNPTDAVAEMLANNALWQSRQEGEKALETFGIALGYLSMGITGDADRDFMAWHSFVHTWYLANAHATASFWAGRVSDLEAANVRPRVSA